MNNNKNGKVLVISGPSGVGKSTIESILTKLSGFKKVPSVTTRTKRDYEYHGVDYFFIDNDIFSGMVNNNEFVHHFSMYDNNYGLQKALLEKCVNDGEIAICTVEPNTMLKLKNETDIPVISIFLMPPENKEETLRNRLEKRGESVDKIEKRLALLPQDLKMSTFYDHIVINNNIKETTKEVLRLLHRKPPKLNKGIKNNITSGKNKKALQL